MNRAHSLKNNMNRVAVEQTSFETEDAYFDRTYRTQHAEHVHHETESFDERSYYIRPYDRTLSELSPSGLPGYSEPKSKVCDLSQFPKWETARDEVKLIRKLGQGSFGEVWYGEWRNNTEVAVKKLRKDSTMTKEEFLQEAAIMMKIKHHRLVALRAVCSKKEPFYIVQEYMSKGSLVEFLRSDAGKMLPITDLIFIAAQVAKGMAYLEEEKFIHRDLAARNVVIDNEMMAKICDFGLAKDLKVENCFIGGIYTNQGSPYAVRWAAPEVIKDGHFSIKSDVWSYGILLMELFTYGDVPYPGMSDEDVRENIKGGYRMPKSTSQNLPDSVYNIMLQCWNQDPQRRPTFDSLCLTMSELISRVNDE